MNRASSRQLLGVLIFAGLALAAERQLSDARHESPPSAENDGTLILYAQMLDNPPIDGISADMAFDNSLDEHIVDGGLTTTIGPARPLELHVRWVLAPSSSVSESLKASSRAMGSSLLQIAGLLLLGLLLRQLGEARIGLDARLRPTPSLPAFFTCCALAALLPQLMLLRHELDSPSSLAIASAATLIYAATWMAARRSAVWRALSLARDAASLVTGASDQLAFLRVRILRVEGELVRLIGERYERTAVVEFADGTRGRISLEHADLDSAACAELVQAATQNGRSNADGPYLWVLGRVEQGVASAEAAEPLCRDVAAELRINGPLLLVGTDRATLFNQLACELLILASVGTLATAFLLSRR